MHSSRRLLGAALLRTTACMLSALALAATASAQGDRVNLLSRVDDYGAYNDVWGYENNGREIAILGTFGGTAFYETTNPSAPVLKKFIGHTGSTWSDIATLGKYAYVVNEGGGGLQIIDLRDLDDIQLVSTYNGFSTGHNIYIDAPNKRAWIPGANTGMPILDLTNKTNPVQVGNYTSRYVHDVFVQDGWAHLAEIYEGDYRLIDSGTLATQDRIQTPGNFTHNTWTNDANTICVTTDESSGGHLGIYDISNKQNIIKLAEYSANSGGIIHNAHIDGDIVHMSYYGEGYVAVDISNPAQPKKVGSYDTYGGSSGGYDGCWGVYPFQPSGVIYASDITGGLFVLAPALAVEHTPLEDTLDRAGPYTAVATVTGGAAQSAELTYSTDDWTTETTLSMTPTGNPDEWSVDVPGLPGGTTAQYFISASDGSATGVYPETPGDRVVFSVGVRTTHFFADFESNGDQGWTHGQKQTQDDWQRGTPQGKAGDPSFAFSGTRCWCNDRGADGWNGSYQDDVDNWLQSPNIDLGTAENVRLRFKRWLTVEGNGDDQARLRINSKLLWENPTQTLLDSGWVTYDVDVSDQADGVSDTFLKWVLKSDSNTNFGGWNIDDVELYSVSDCTDDEHYGIGFAGTGNIVPTLATSGGAPFVGNSSFALEGVDILGGAQTFLLLASGRDQIPYKGIDVWVDLAGFWLLFPKQASGTPGVGGDGAVTFPFGIPNDPGLIGIEADCQLLVVDPAGPRGWAGTDGLAFWICDG